jgi:Zn-finger nucleic acid-binding protein
MSEPFRGAAYPCPSCSAGLRPCLERFVCDACGGMLIGVDDLAASISDMSGVETTISFHADETSGTKCPRCDRELMRGTMDVRSNAEVAQLVLHCARDGVWFADGWLVDLYTRIGHQVGAGVGSGKFYGGTGAGGAPPRVGLLQPPKPKARIATAYRSAHRDLACPVCRGALIADGGRWSCDAHGVFVENDALVQLMGEISGEPWQMPAPVGAPGERACPVCDARLTIEGIDAILVDRCGTHGIWFDTGELADALAVAAKPRRGWLRRLFGD